MKDPAVLFYINDWLVSTADMDADVRGWFLNLLLHNYDKGSLPNDIEKLAVLCNVRFSEFNRFEQVFEQVLKHKFNKDEFGNLTNQRTSDILKSREIFKEKRSNAGKMSYLMRFFSKKFPQEFKKKKVKEFIQENFDFDSIDLKNEQMLEQVFEQMFELYRNENEIENKDLNKNKDLENWKEELQLNGADPKDIDDWLKIRKEKKAPFTERALKKILNECQVNNFPVYEAVKVCADKGWQGFEYSWVAKNLNNGKSNQKDRGHDPLGIYN
ncbi:hypothetical protein [Empedobacter brevis]|uniref:hypothetical protein n=1 Tax=Empedobacter brevis TaxID=247 RepID=UPI00289C4B93|nr:hypothetical protein [Empedobacter brevis]